jgi:lantibiotic nisin-U
MKNKNKEVAMTKYDDFKLDMVKVIKTQNNAGITPVITSKSLCTPGCITGWLQGCNIKTATCGCHF